MQALETIRERVSDGRSAVWSTMQRVPGFEKANATLAALGERRAHLANLTDTWRDRWIMSYDQTATSANAFLSDILGPGYQTIFPPAFNCASPTFFLRLLSS